MSSSTKAESPIEKTECKISCDLEILRQSPVFSGADSEVLKLFAYLAERKKYRVGDQVIKEGTDAEKAYYLITGTAEVTTSHRGNEVVLQQLLPQTFFGELALLAQFKWFFSVQTLEECEILEISRESFRKILDKFPNKREKLIEKIVQLRIQRLTEQTEFMLNAIPDSYAIRGATSI